MLADQFQHLPNLCHLLPVPYNECSKPPPEGGFKFLYDPALPIKVTAAAAAPEKEELCGTPISSMAECPMKALLL